MIKLYNTLSRKKETLQTKRKGNVSLFVCGPTVYDFSHLGHARTYISFDAFVKFLRSQKYKVDYLQNITDIDDKIIQRAKIAKVTPAVLAKRFEKEYLKDMKALGVESVSSYAKATQHIQEIISQIKRLLKKGYAYEIKGDGLYYDILKFKDYGKLSHRTYAQGEDAVSRIDESIQKKNKGDFALWKFSKEGLPAQTEEPKWKSPFGEGRPGWHIEDTAITEKHLGVQYDIHGGAKDLIFPHHEAEIAQMEAISGKKPMARHWIHTGFLTVEGEKMAKSVGNFITIQDFLKTHSARPAGRPLRRASEARGSLLEAARVLRFLVLKTHYRSPINYSENLLLQTQRELERIDEFTAKLNGQLLNQVKQSWVREPLLNLVKQSQGQFLEALEDDFNTPKAIAVLFNIVTKGNTLLAKDSLSQGDAKAIYIFLKEIDEIFGFVFSNKKKTAIPLDILELVKKREQYRKEKQWEKADDIRKQLLKQGWQLNDTPNGTKLKKIS